MISQNTSLKYILTTVSTLAIVVSIANEASAAPAAVQTATAAGLNQTSNGSGMGGRFNSGDSIMLSNLGAAASISIDSPKAIAGIDLNGKAPTGIITVSISNANLGSIGNAVGGSAIRLNLNDGVALTLTGTSTIANKAGVIVVGANNYSGLGPVTLGSTQAGAPNTDLNINIAGNVVFSALTTINTFAATTGNWATLNISGGNHTFNGVIGGISKLGNINILTANTMTFNAHVTATDIILSAGSTMVVNNGVVINSAIDGTLANNGTLNLSGNHTINQAIGATHSLSAINILTADIITIAANVTAQNISLAAGSVMVVNNGVVINSTIDGANAPMEGAVDDSGTLNLSGNHIFNKTIGATHSLSAINILTADIITYNTNVTATNITLAAGSTMVVGNGAVANAAIDGDGDNHGTLVLTNQAPRAAIGSTKALDTVRLAGWRTGAAGVGNQINAQALDITGGTVIKLDANISSITTGITSSDNSSKDFTSSYAVFDAPAEINVGISNLGVATKITGAGTLTATTATPLGNNKVMLDFRADGQFSLTGNGTIDVITNSTGIDGKGTFQSRLAAGGNLSFTGPIGANGARLKELSLSGAGPTSTITFANEDIYAQNVVHAGLILDSTAHNLNIHTDTYTLANTSINIGDKTIAVTGGRVILQGNVVIQASYVDGDHNSLDFSVINLANLDTSAFNSLTFQITAENPPPRDTIMTVISNLADNGFMFPSNKVSLVNSGLWRISNHYFGEVIFNPTPEQLALDAALDKTRNITHATTYDIENAQNIITNDLGGIGIIASDDPAAGNVTGAKQDQFILSIFDPRKFNNDLSTRDGANALLTAIGTDGNQKGFLSFTNIQILLVKDNVFIPLDQAAAYAIVAKKQAFIPDIMADSIADNGHSGIAQGLAQEIIEVYANNGAQKVQEMADRITNAASNASSTNFDAIGARSAFINLPITTFAPPPSISIASSSNLYAEEQGVAAGSSPYDRFGIWGSVNGGIANQKERRGNDGFRLTSRSFVIGIDTMINDYTSLGFAASNSKTNIAHKNASDGNKTKATSWIMSLYGNHQFQNNWFARGTALVNRTHINNKELRVITGGYGIAQGKYNLMSCGGEANVGYYHKFGSDFIATPTIGVRIMHNKKISYGETGNTRQNHKNISQKAMNNYSALAGLSLAKTFSKNDISFIPEAHVNFQYGLNTKTPKGSFVSPLTPSQTTSFVGTRASKLTSTYGISFTGSNDRLECGINGDITVASKYTGYQGGIKLKVKF